MKIRTKTGKILDLEKVRIRHHQNPLFTGTHEDYDDVLDALEAALSVPFNYDEEADHYAEPWVDGHCAALDAVHKAAGLVNEN